MPELKGSSIIKIEKTEGEIADRKYKIRKHTNQLEKYGQKEQAQKIRDEYNTLTEELKRNQEELKRNPEELRAWDLLLGNRVINIQKGKDVFVKVLATQKKVLK